MTSAKLKLYVAFLTALCGQYALAQVNLVGLSAAQVEVQLESIEKEYRNSKSKSGLSTALQKLEDLKNKTSLLQALPANQVSKKFRDFHLSLIEVRDVQERLNSCAKFEGKVSGSLARKVELFTDSLIEQSASEGGIPTPNACVLDRSSGLNDLDQFTKILLPKLPASLSPAAVTQDSMGSALSPEARRLQKEASSNLAFSRRADEALRNSGTDLRVEGPATSRFIKAKYGFDLKDEDTRAKTLHEKLMEGNRENCLNNYLYYTSHFSFSDEPVTKSFQDVQSKAIEFFGKAKTLNYLTMPEDKYESDRLARAGMLELTRISKQYPKPKTLDDAFKELGPAIDDFLQANADLRAEKSIRFGLYDDSFREKQSRKSELAASASQSTERGYEKMQQSEAGFLLQSDVFQRGIQKIRNLPENARASEIKRLLKASLQEQIQNTKKYAQWISTVQGDRTFFETDKKKVHYDLNAEVLLYSSPNVIARLIQKNPELVASLCGPLKKSAELNDTSPPAWVTWGGGTFSLVGGPLGYAASIAFGTVVTAAVLDDAQKKIQIARNQKDFAGTGDRTSDRNFRDIVADREDREKTIQLQSDRIDDQAKALFGTTIGGGVIQAGKTYLTRQKEIASFQKLVKEYDDKVIDYHVLSGELSLNPRSKKPLYLLKGGLHTSRGVEEFRNLRPDLAEEFRVETLSNGVQRAFIPKQAVFSKTFENVERAMKAGDGFVDREAGIMGKTLFPASWSDEKIKSVIQYIKVNGTSTGTGRGGVIFKMGMYEGVKINIVLQEKGPAYQIITAYPTWNQ